MFAGIGFAFVHRFAAILSRMCSPVTSHSNWAKNKSTLRVSRPMLLVVLNACVMLTRSDRKNREIP